MVERVQAVFLSLPAVPRCPPSCWNPRATHWSCAARRRAQPGACRGVARQPPPSPLSGCRPSSPNALASLGVNRAATAGEDILSASRPRIWPPWARWSHSNRELRGAGFVFSVRAQAGRPAALVPTAVVESLSANKIPGHCFDSRRGTMNLGTRAAACLLAAKHEFVHGTRSLLAACVSAPLGVSPATALAPTPLSTLLGVEDEMGCCKAAKYSALKKVLSLF